MDSIYSSPAPSLETQNPTALFYITVNKHAVLERRWHWLLLRWSAMFTNSANTLHSYRALQSSYMINALLCHAQPFHSHLNIWGNVSKTVLENVAQLFYCKSYGMSWNVQLYSVRKGTEVSCLEIMTKKRSILFLVNPYLLPSMKRP